MGEGFDVCLCYNQSVSTERDSHQTEWASIAVLNSFLIFLHMQTINSPLSIIPKGRKVLLVMRHAFPWTKLHHLFAHGKWKNIN